MFINILLKTKLKYSYSFDVKDKKGTYSEGTKITNFDFIDNYNFLVTTNDNSIRLINGCDGKTSQKFKGCKNNKSILRSFYDDYQEYVISCSDEGGVHIWRKLGL